MKTFRMIRNQDESGVSGVGLVVEGIEFSDGTVSARWTTTTASSCFYDSFDDFLAIHVYSHANNNTEIHWGNGEIWRQADFAPVLDEYF